jgi:hypothetical protein
MADDDGVLGNLPRSRPGRRSEKRERDGAAAGRAPGGSKRTASPRASGRSARAAGAKDEAAAPARGADPLGGAVRAAAGVAGVGVRVASGLAREVLRRLPRP